MLTLIHTGLLHLDSDDERVPQSLTLRHQWTVIAAGSAAAALVAWLLVPVASLLQPSPFVIITASCLFVALAGAAGFLGAWIAELTLAAALLYDATQITRRTVAAWIFFPSVALLCHKASPLALFAALIASVALILGLRTFFLPCDEPKAAPPPTQPLAALYGLPASSSDPWFATFIAICAIGTLVCLFNSFLFSAVLLLALSVSLPLWSWSVFSPHATAAPGKPGVRYSLAALALILTIVAVAPTSFADGLWPFIGPAHHSLYAAHTTGNLKGVQRDYVSIILLPPPVQKTRIIPPPPSSGASTAQSKSVVIPFDGSYWYFQPPAVGPGAQAHQAHGQPTTADIRSNSAHPLAMEAHQKLDLPIDLSCCRAIDLAITNADTRPLPIALRIQLQDSNSRQTIDLGRLTIHSSTVVPIHLNRPPVHETLRFLIPSAKPLTRFDRITVIYQPDPARSQVGAKVSVDSFTLVPR